MTRGVDTACVRLVEATMLDWVAATPPVATAVVTGAWVEAGGSSAMVETDLQITIS